MAPARLCLEQDRPPFVNRAFGLLDVVILALFFFLLLRNHHYHICLAQQTTWNKVTKFPLWKLQRWSQWPFPKIALHSFCHSLCQCVPLCSGLQPFQFCNSWRAGKEREDGSMWVAGERVCRFCSLVLNGPWPDSGLRPGGLGTPACMDLTQSFSIQKCVFPKKYVLYTFWGTLTLLFKAEDSSQSPLLIRIIFLVYQSYTYSMSEKQFWAHLWYSS